MITLRDLLRLDKAMLELDNHLNVLQYGIGAALFIAAFKPCEAFLSYWKLGLPIGVPCGHSVTGIAGMLMPEIRGNNRAAGYDKLMTGSCTSRCGIRTFTEIFIDRNGCSRPSIRANRGSRVGLQKATAAMIKEIVELLILSI
jgi:hypothetical protein